jgi:hypothetical protein
MSFLPAAAVAGGDVIGSIIGGKGQQNAANTAAQEQEAITQKYLDYLQNAGASARTAINSILPYSQSGSQAASTLQATAPYLAPGQGAMFGGQQINSNATSGSDLSKMYSGLLSPTATNQTHAPSGLTPGQLAQALSNANSRPQGNPIAAQPSAGAGVRSLQSV